MNYEAVLCLNKCFNHSEVETTLRYIGYYESADENMDDGSSKSIKIEETK